MKKSLIVAAAATLISVPVVAQEGETSPKPCYHFFYSNKDSWYVPIDSVEFVRVMHRTGRIIIHGVNGSKFRDNPPTLEYRGVVCTASVTEQRLPNSEFRHPWLK